MYHNSGIGKVKHTKIDLNEYQFNDGKERFHLKIENLYEHKMAINHKKPVEQKGN